MGVRVDLQAKLDCARIALQMDIGFGDAITSAPESVSYPVLLEDLPAPQLRAYPKYTVVWWPKSFMRCVCWAWPIPRVKDYFDLWVLLTEGAPETAELRRAAEATFARRKLVVPSTLPRA